MTPCSRLLAPARACAALSRALLSGALLSGGALAGGTSLAPTPAPPAAAALAPREAASAALVQVVHRDARLKSGALDATAVTAAADLAAETLTGQDLSLDAWAALTGGKPAAVVARPAAGPLARAVFERVRLLGKPATLVEGDAAPPKGARVIAVLAPAWREGPVAASGAPAAPAAPAAGGAPAAPVLPAMPAAPAAVFIDVFETTVGTETWRPDTLLATRDAAVASAAMEYVLRARAAGKVPDWSALLAARSRSAARVAWTRLALD